MSGEARMAAAAVSAAVELVAPKMALVEEEIQAHMRSRFGPINEAGQYLSETAGKRLRPLLVLLSAALAGYEGPDDVLLGAVFETVHTASLVHDDIVDEAVVRRGRAAANRVFGNSFAVLFGDFLYIRSVNMALRTKNMRLLEILAEATERMIEGELLGDRLRGRADVTREQHLEIVERKTAALFSGACRVGAIIADAPPAVEDGLARFGLGLGMAFQLVDDLLDIVGNEATVGKPVASDLREGRLTLPWIDLLRCGSAEDRGAVLQVLKDGGFEKVSFRRLRAALEKNGCLEGTRLLAEEHAAAAIAALDGLPDGPHRDALRRLPDALLVRRR